MGTASYSALNQTEDNGQYVQSSQTGLVYVSSNCMWNEEVRVIGGHIIILLKKLLGLCLPIYFSMYLNGKIIIAWAHK